ncbi:MAG TPA: sulfite reductase flavoprotein subunit alpha [Terracidiphilus sp.]|nr:sulfite reductase flavoprotein subunit alpha [Terracidiphilus sp.]
MPTTFVPSIPDTAPFNAEQRAWLNGFLAGIFSQQAAETSAPAKNSLRIAVLYASQSGTAEGLARKLAKELKSAGHAPAVSTLVGYTPAALAAEEHALIIASTYGDGEAPDGVQPFYEQLCVEHFPKLEKLSYSLLALGDSHYEYFCKFGKDLDAKLKALGANCIHPRVDSDVETEQAFAGWTSGVLEHLAKPTQRKTSSPASETALTLSESAPALAVHKAAFTRDNPLLAPVVDRRDLNITGSTKATIHLALCIDGTGLAYEAGDACGVLPNNDELLVAEVLQTLRCNGNESVKCEKVEATTLHDALMRHLQITRLTRKTVGDYAARSQSAMLLELARPERREQLESYIYDRGLIDLLLEHPVTDLEPSELVAMLPRLTPRLYSISSSPKAHAGEVHATVGVIRYTSHKRDRGGVCSTMFADRIKITDQVPIFIQPNKKFKIPKDPAQAMIMIGPGTGIAPFRGFLHERLALGHKGKNWLFFGERSAKTDFLYRDELDPMLKDGHLTRLDTAFSRDQEQKVYVQDRMLENAPMLWRWLESGASVYVCGDARQMAKDVDRTLRQIAQEQGGKSAEQANEYVDVLKSSDRYHRDVY